MRSERRGRLLSGNVKPLRDSATARVRREKAWPDKYEWKVSQRSPHVAPDLFCFAFFLFGPLKRNLEPLLTGQLVGFPIVLRSVKTVRRRKHTKLARVRSMFFKIFYRRCFHKR